METHCVDSVDSIESDQSMNWGQFSDSLYYLSLPGAVVAFVSSI